MTDPSDLPYELGVCRDCSRLKLLTATTITGEDAGMIYYCTDTKHRTEGRTHCGSFSPRRDR